MKIHRLQRQPGQRRAAAMAAAAAAWLLSACAADKLEHPSYWWDAKVVSVQPLSQVPAGASLDCISGGGAPSGGSPAPAGDDARADDPRVLVVQYRMGKSLVSKVYPDPPGATWASGERVRVHPDTCRIRPAARTG